MADFRRHITVSTVCGVAFGGLVVNPLGYSADAGFLAAGVTAVGGMLPDLDSDSGIPVREMSNLAAATIPLLLIPRLIASGIGSRRRPSLGGISLSLYSIHCVVGISQVDCSPWNVPQYSRYGDLRPDRLSRISLIQSRSPITAGRRGDAWLLLTSSLGLNFTASISQEHDCRLNKSAGSALKFVSPSWKATCICYGILLGLFMTAYAEFQMMSPNQ